MKKPHKMKTESEITSILMKENRLPVGVWEIKRTKGRTIPFSSFANHQIDSLMKAKHQRLNVKIRDVGIHKKPFDGMTFFKSPSWCVCCYPSSNKHGFTAYSIDIDAWYLERRMCKQKSLKEDRAKTIGISI